MLKVPIFILILHVCNPVSGDCKELQVGVNAKPAPITFTGPACYEAGKRLMQSWARHPNFRIKSFTCRKEIAV